MEYDSKVFKEAQNETLGEVLDIFNKVHKVFLKIKRTSVVEGLSVQINIEKYLVVFAEQEFFKPEFYQQKEKERVVSLGRLKYFSEKEICRKMNLFLAEEIIKNKQNFLREARDQMVKNLVKKFEKAKTKEEKNFYKDMAENLYKELTPEDYFSLRIIFGNQIKIQPY